MNRPLTNSIFAVSALSLLITCRPVEAVAMPLDGTWIEIQEVMDEGDFFTGTWTWNSTESVKFDITDLYIVTDVFEIYDFGVPIFSTPLLPDWNDLGFVDDDDIFATSGDDAWPIPQYSKGSHIFAPGNHSITIKLLQKPTNATDGTATFRATIVPDTGGLSLSFISLFALAGFARLKRRRRA